MAGIVRLLMHLCFIAILSLPPLLQAAPAKIETLRAKENDLDKEVDELVKIRNQINSVIEPSGLHDITLTLENKQVRLVSGSTPSDDLATVQAVRSACDGAVEALRTENLAFGTELDALMEEPENMNNQAQGFLNHMRELGVSTRERRIDDVAGAIHAKLIKLEIMARRAANGAMTSHIENSGE